MSKYNEEEKEYLLYAIDSMKREVVVISSTFQIVAANSFAKEQYGQGIIGQYCYSVYFGLNSPCKVCPVLNCANNSNNQSQTSVSKESMMLEEGVICYPIHSKGKVNALLRMDCDTPHIDKLKEKLQRTNAFLYNLIVSSVDAVIAADKKGNILIFNDAASEILGYTKQEALTKLDIRNIYPEDGAKEVMKKLRSSDFGGIGKLKAYQVNLLNKRNELIPVSLNASIIYERGKEVATIGFFHDMRETLKMEKELEDTRIQLFQSAKMAALGKLAAGVAHQINNPLGGISLFAQLLLEEYDLQDDAKQDIQRIIDDAQRCKETVKELLEFARQSTYKAKPEDINKALNRTVFLLEKHAIFHDIEIDKNFDTDLPYVPCDIQQMSHVFMNIILNAAEAMDGEGKLEIITSRKNMDRIVIQFIDTGPGISNDVLPYIFDPFYTTKEEGKGTGLGLSVAYRIVQNHDGRIMAENRPEGGVCFTIELPCKTQEGDENDE